MSKFLVVSLDFELRWGMHDVLDRGGLNLGAYRENLEGVREVVPALLDLFERTGVHATWATVAALACSGWEEYRARAPKPPQYSNPGLQLHAETEKADPHGRLYFAPELVQAVAAAKGQELASHTFSHTYFREPGCMRRDVEADCAAVAGFFTERFGRAPSSLVFPRNQVAFEDVLQAAGIENWRENQEPWFWQATTGLEENLAIRLTRLSDSFAAWGSRASKVTRSGGQAASYFVRYNLKPALWALQRRRIVEDAKALGDGEALHLWWHPHNLGADPKTDVARAAELLDAVRSATRGELTSTSMTELYRARLAVA